MVPEAEIITPIRDNKLSREEEIAYLEGHGVKMDAHKAMYSINQGIWGTSVGGKETLTSHSTLPEQAFPSQMEDKESIEIELEFFKGEPVKVNGDFFAHPTALIEWLNRLAGPYAIGRDIHVGDTIIGIKGRVGFEAAAPMIIIKAHHLLEKHVLTKQQLFWKDQLSNPYGNYLHEGLFYEPVMRDLEAFLESSQEHVTGKVFIKLKPYQFELIGIESEFDLMSNAFGSYGEVNNAWSGDDVKGFAKIFSNQIMIYRKIKESNEQE